MNFTNQSGQSIVGQLIYGALGDGITLNGCSNFRIYNNIIKGAKANGITLINCQSIFVYMNHFEDVATGIYCENCTNVIILFNECLNVQGPFPRGQFAQFNTCQGGKINFNRIENILGSSNPEDAINIFKSNGTPKDNIEVIGNWIRGGGPSKTGGGIMLGDNGGSYQLASNNVLVNPGQYGIGVAGGTNISVVTNTIFSKSQPFSNVGVYNWNQSKLPSSGITIGGNKINFQNASGQLNSSWNAESTMPTGWNTNDVVADIKETILPQILTFD